MIKTKRRYAFVGGKRWLIVKGANGEDGMIASYVQSCSGCHETEDGHSIGVYPIHPKHGCKIGGGCFECGYHGIRRNRCWVPLPSWARVPSREKAEE